MFTLEKGMRRFTEVHVLDEKGEGGAYHRYSVAGVTDHQVYSLIQFQKGAVKQSGVNGIFIEDLLHICAHRLECFQAGDFACKENAEALAAIEQAIKSLNTRTADRQARNVEGTNKL
jgi:hypothetical protein